MQLKVLDEEPKIRKFDEQDEDMIDKNTNMIKRGIRNKGQQSNASLSSTIVMTLGLLPTITIQCNSRN